MMNNTSLISFCEHNVMFAWRVSKVFCMYKKMPFQLHPKGCKEILHLKSGIREKHIQVIEEKS